jgi:hypothetical protein
VCGSGWDRKPSQKRCAHCALSFNDNDLQTDKVVAPLVVLPRPLKVLSTELVVKAGLLERDSRERTRFVHPSVSGVGWTVHSLPIPAYRMGSQNYAHPGIQDGYSPIKKNETLSAVCASDSVTGGRVKQAHKDGLVSQSSGGVNFDALNNIGTRHVQTAEAPTA